MELIILGSGTAALQAHRGPSGYVLQAGDETYLLDGGTGTLLRAAQVGISYQEIDKIFYTHLHPDHSIDLAPFLFATKHTPGFVRTQKLQLFGPVGFRSFFAGLISLYGTGLTEVEYEIEIHELAESQIAHGSTLAKTRLMQHVEGAVGYRFERNGKAFVYSGDTDVCDAIIELARNADVLLLECSFPDNMKVAGHLTPTEAGQIASKAEVGKLILTHLYPPCDEIDVAAVSAKQFSGDILVAKDLMKITI